MSRARTAVVAGGGIVGLVAATALAQAGLEVTLIERKSELGDDGGIGMGLQSNALAALARIGVAAECVASGISVDNLEIYTPAGELLAKPPVPRNGGPEWPGFLGISRAVLHAILVAAAESAGATLLSSAALSSLEQDADGVRVGLADGRTLTADLLVGADGIYSSLRGMLFPDHPGPFATGEGVWRARIAPGAALPRVAMIFGGKVGTVGHTPITNGEGYLYAVDRLERAPARGARDLRPVFRELIADYKAFPARLLPFLTNEVNYRPLEAVDLPAPWWKARTILIGDAAHAGPPTLAQGAAMGIEDAVVLAECLEAEADFPAAATNFMQRRRHRVHTVIEASIAISRAQMRPDGAAEMAAAQRAAAEVLAQPF